MRKFAVLILMFLPILIHAQDTKFTALLLINFAKYIEWPPDAVGADYVITVLGDDAVVDELNSLAAKTKVGDKGVVVKKVASISQAEKTHILYITPDQSSALPSAVSKLGSGATLIVTNKKGLAKEGSAINLTAAGGQLRYEINSGSMKKTGLVPKPVLFKLGSTVQS